MLIQSGGKIPADGVLIRGKLSIDNSAMNGESEECEKDADESGYTLPEKTTSEMFTDRHSMFKGTTVYSGEGVMRVDKVGMKTMLGEMAADSNGEEVESPLKVKLNILAGQISKFGYIGSVVIALANMLFCVLHAGGPSAYISNGIGFIIKDLLEAVSAAIVIVVCAVPEGLPMMISIVLGQNTGKLLKANVLVRKAIGIETAGSLNILFSDKTGTITKGHLEVTELFDGSGRVLDKSNSGEISSNLDLAICRNTASMYDTYHHVINGNATDQAVMRYVGEETYLKVISDESSMVETSQPFNSANKFSQAYIKNVGKTFYKGAPEKLLMHATKYLASNGEEKPLNKKIVLEHIDELAEKAMRVLGFAYSREVMAEDKLHDDLVIIGFVGIRDDVRPEAVTAIKEVQDAGIQVVMITGDKKETAVAIAKDAGLIKSNTDIALTSDELNCLSDNELKAKLKNIRVIARALPTDKSRMVRICQSMNLVTGMTGDGSNDAPALKRADVGFSMGSGTAAAKEASDIVIEDDNFKSIRNAILYGRTVYNNILKFIKFQLTINVAAVGISSIAPFIGVESPLKVVHLLWINLIMDSLGSLALGNEPAIEEYMKERPRRRDESIVSKPMMVQICIMGAYLLAMSIFFLKSSFVRSIFGSQEQLLTGYFSFFVLSAVFNGFNVRDEGLNVLKGINLNPGFLKVMSSITLVQVLITMLGGSVFSCTPFGIFGWALVIGLAFTMIPVDMLRKLSINFSVKKPKL